MHFVAAAAVLLASYGAGRIVTIPLGIGGLRGSVTAFAVGFATLELAALGLGSIGLFRADVLGGLAIAVAGLGLWWFARDVRAAWRREWSVAERVLLGSTVGLLVVDGVLASAPPTSGDAIAYHLVAPKLWLESGEMHHIWWDWQSLMPFAVEMHFAFGHALAGGSAAMLVGAGFGAFSAVCVYGLAAQLASPRAAAAAALLWVGQAMFLWEATGAFVELTLAAFAALAAWHLVVFARTHRPLDSALAGLAAGLCASIKYQGLFALAAAGLVLLALSTRRGRRLAVVGAFAAGTVVALPWYLRTWAATGNPVYPLFFEQLGGRYWGPSGQAVLEDIRETYGVDGIWRLPLLPLEFVLHRERFDRPYAYSPALFLLAPFALALRQRWTWTFAGLLAAFLVVWFELMDQVDRYLLVALPLASVLAGTAAVRLWERRRVARAFVVAVGAASALLLVVMTALFARQVLSGAVGVEDETPFVQRLTGTNDAFTWLERELPTGGRVLVGIRDLYWLDRPYARWSAPLFGDLDPPEQVARRMRQYDVRYLAFFRNELPPPLVRLRDQLVHVNTLAVPYVTSRTLGRIDRKELVVYAWCRDDSPPTLGCPAGPRA